ncbi:MAG: redoxin domain-containing protein [Acidobacteria bacterium]|nr:redoxin domain-containing protein [Acidobacteriota bacterium]
MTGPHRQMKTIVAALMLTSSVPAFAQTVRVGQPAPDFAVASLDGESTIRLSDFRGRRVLIFNWATW